MSEQLTGEVTELLQNLIRNACVNDGTPNSGGETRNADVLNSYLEGVGLDIDVREAIPGRESVVARLPGTDPTAPSLMLMGHTDVVPANASNWTVDPFGGELSDGKVWGRGAIDMLNLTASMAVAMRHLAASGSAFRGDLVFLGVADEEAGGEHGAKFLLNEWPDLVRTDYVLTEWGGVQLPGSAGSRVGVTVGEKSWGRWTLKVKGASGHASMPLHTDNALIKAAKVISRIDQLQFAPSLDATWHRFVEGMGYDDDLVSRLLDPTKVDDAIDELPVGLGRRLHACIRPTVTPTVIHGGTKSNVIPDVVEIVVDIRTPHQGETEIRALLIEALGDLASSVEIHVDSTTLTEANQSPVDTPLWDVMEKVSAELKPGAVCVPTITAGSTDAYYFRDHGATAYGFGMFSHHMTLDAFVQMFHGEDEWVDQESLYLSTVLWQRIAQQFLN